MNFEDLKRQKCPVCGKAYMEYLELKNPVSTVIPVTRHIACPDCGFNLSLNSRADGHEVSQDEARIYLNMETYVPNLIKRYKVMKKAGKSVWDPSLEVLIKEVKE